ETDGCQGLVDFMKRALRAYSSGGEAIQPFQPSSVPTPTYPLRAVQERGPVNAEAARTGETQSFMAVVAGALHCPPRPPEILQILIGFGEFLSESGKFE
ncbi:hypothetical protein NHX12_018463, partial [Muraenolepis orangiensis]